MYTLFLILAGIILYTVSIMLSIRIDNYCEKKDPHHNESIWWLLIPGFNVIIELIFLLVIIIHKEK